jgi:hypothetical protein
VVQAARELFGNVPAGSPEPSALPLRHPVAATLIWCLVILAIFVPMAIHRYKKAVSR